MGGDNQILSQESKNKIQTAEVVLPCSELEETLAFYTESLGFRVDTIFPADNPSIAVISAYGIRIRLQKDAKTAPGHLRLECTDRANDTIVAPNGTRIEFVNTHDQLVLPPEKQSFVLSRMSESSAWHLGRAGMRYRDLIPNRQGGRFIASHIQIPQAGPVGDYVHYHKIRFQMIYCYKGWVKLVYEDQGPPFILQAGDCVLQPPQIRHRVLESSEGLEVVEIGCPAEHETYADHDMQLPTQILDPQRDFGGQRFVHHKISQATFENWRINGFEMRDLGIADATDGLVGGYVVRSVNYSSAADSSSEADNTPVKSINKEEFLFFFILSGQLNLFCDTPGNMTLNPGDACVVPANLSHSLVPGSGDFEMLEVRLSADFDNTSIQN